MTANMCAFLIVQVAKAAFDALLRMPMQDLRYDSLLVLVWLSHQYAVFLDSSLPGAAQLTLRSCQVILHNIVACMLWVWVDAWI